MRELWTCASALILLVLVAGFAAAAPCTMRHAANGAWLPDSICTPGHARPSADKAEVCRQGSARDARYVTAGAKRDVYREYGIATHKPGEYEVDHLVSLELGGSNDISNLWPEPAAPKPGFHEKDSVESYLHRQVCAGRMTLAAAQALIARDWTQALPMLPAKKGKR